ncbi:helix-turn-helix domain-containing protein [Nocardia nova]|uniref:HTH luxR-type domain-containing protein n=1 Tax=Nocardia nova TaxID=37330 RepID=A0A2S6A1Z2_9NOCA|nr:helix-turn-helix transcriptional regulator [Nocardia nova]PPJ25564.1 hypothetical protein C5F51_22250 [Nocardia nova]
MNRPSAVRALDTLLRRDDELRTHLGLGVWRSEPDTLTAAIALSEKTIAVALRHRPPAAADAAQAGMITAILDAQLQAREVLLRARSRRIAALAASITRLRATTSVDALVREMCAELTGGLEFRCATYSTVDSSGCTVRHGHPEAVGAPLQTPVPWRPGPAEKRCLAEHRPAVGEPATAGLGNPIIAPDGVSGYVVAPIIVGAEVFALIHAARELPWAVDSTDVQLVDLIASAFAAVYDREVRVARIRHQRQTLLAAVRRLADDTESMDDASFALGIEDTSTPLSAPIAPMRPSLQQLLTPREGEVLKLIVAGASNNEIAEQLVITVETVKSHVKRILRKLGAVNRSEVISLYLEDRRPTRQ